MTSASSKTTIIRSFLGLALALAATAAFSQNLVLNGSFETEDANTMSAHFSQLTNSTSPTSWTYGAGSYSPNSYVVSNAATSSTRDADGHFITAEDGEWYAALGGGFSGTGPDQSQYDSLTQKVQTEAGHTYTLSYWEYNYGGKGSETGNWFNVTWNGQVISGSQISAALTARPWTQFSFSVVGTGGMDEIGLNGAANYRFSGVDNVSLVDQAVPEPSSLAVIGIGLAGLFIKRRK